MAIRAEEAYARALLEWALEEKKEKEVRLELERVSQLLKDSQELREFLFRKVFSGVEKEAVLREVLNQIKISSLTRNFLLHLAKGGRFHLFLKVLKEFHHKCDELAHIKEATVTSAIELSKPFQRKIEERFEKWTGRKLKVSYEVNPTLLGGVVTKIGNIVFDGSVRSQLKQLENQLEG